MSVCLFNHSVHNSKFNKKYLLVQDLSLLLELVDVNLEPGKLSMKFVSIDLILLHMMLALVVVTNQLLVTRLQRQELVLSHLNCSSRILPCILRLHRYLLVVCCFYLYQLVQSLYFICHHCQLVLILCHLSFQYLSVLVCLTQVALKIFSFLPAVYLMFANK